MKVGRNQPCPCGSGRKYKQCCLPAAQTQPALTDLSAEQLLAQRFQALATADFAFVYASYHPEAPFLQQFPDQADYLSFARQQLADIPPPEWRPLKQRQIAADECEILLWMRVGGPLGQELFESALLLRTPAGWRYHSGQKLTRKDYAGPIEEIDFRHFDQASQKVRF